MRLFPLLMLLGCPAPQSSEPIHTCFGASLRVLTDESSVEGETLTVGLEEALADVECRHAVFEAIDCVPIEPIDGCGFGTHANAETREAEFREALIALDPVAFTDYPHEVIDDCYCRAY